MPKNQLLQQIIKSALSYLLITISLLFIIWFIATQPIWYKTTNLLLPDVKADRLQSYVEELSQKLPGRNSTEEALQPTVDWLEKQLVPYGETRRQSYKIEDETFHNIIMEFGTKSSEKVERIIVGAHYDTADGLPGADDNASGVAGLIELARLLSETPQSQLTKPIELVFYTLEEPFYYDTVHMGSYVHAKSLKDKEIPVKLMMSLEMIGYFSDQPNSQHFPMDSLKYFYPDTGNFIAVIADLSNIITVRSVKKSFSKGSLPVYSFNAPVIIPGIDFSDHRSYWKMGYPAVMITDTSFNRNKNYHTKADTAEKLDYKKMAQVVQATYQVLMDHLDLNP